MHQIKFREGKKRSEGREVKEREGTPRVGSDPMLEILKNTLECARAGRRSFSLNRI